MAASCPVLSMAAHSGWCAAVGGSAIGRPLRISISSASVIVIRGRWATARTAGCKRSAILSR